MKFKYLRTLPKFTSLGFVGNYCKGSQAPTAVLTGNYIRVYFSARDEQGRSRPFYYDLDIDTLHRVDSGKVNIPLGAAGTADEDGVMPSDVLGGGILYTGWNRVNREDVRFRTACMSYQDGRKEVLIDRNSYGPCGSSMEFRRGDTSYYMTFKSWINGEPLYSISCKNNGFHDYDGEIIPLGPNDGGLARPTSVVINDTDYLIFSRRGKFNYRTDPSESYKLKYIKEYYYDDRPIEDLEILGDNSVMKAYAYPLKVKDKVYLFYNSGQPNDFCSPISVCELIDA